ncbi:MAG: hypothetical protein P8N56_02055 [Schleiferiaceae bacterium]|nr:hypothetical protein [Schleiferiaceae bacterium]
MATREHYKDLESLVVERWKRPNALLLKAFFSAFSSPISVSKGDILLDLNDESYGLYFVLEGVVIEFGQDETGALIIPQVFQKAGLILNSNLINPGASAKTRYKTASPVTYIRVDQSVIESFKNRDGFGELFFTLQQIFLHQARAHFIHLLHFNPIEHIAWIHANQPLIYTTLTKIQLAAFLGVSRATLFRVLGAFKASKVH